MAQKYKWNFDWFSLIPGYGLYRSAKNIIDNIKNDGFQFSDLFGWYGFQQGAKRKTDADEAIEQILGEATSSNNREEYLEDRAHTEEREDTAFQRQVQDMQKAGLSPYTISASPVNSSASSVGSNSVMSKLQMLGYMLDLKNLDLKNKGIINNLIGGIIRALA